MKSTVIKLITLYQIVISPALRQLLGVQSMCRYTVSCSEYTKVVIKKYGMIKGMTLGIRRILSCQPYAKNYGNI